MSILRFSECGFLFFENDPGFCEPLAQKKKNKKIEMFLKKS